MIKLIHGDCLEKMKDIPDQSIDMVLADPPYGTTACKWDLIIDLELMWIQLKRVTKLKSAIVMTASQPFTTKLISSNYKMFKYCWVWEKSHAVGHLNAYKMPMKNIEDICVFYQKQSIYNYQIKDKPIGNIRPENKKRNSSSCYRNHSAVSKRKIPKNKKMPDQLIKFNNCKENLHPTQKPVALMEYLIKTYTNEEQTVLDFTMGSGTTGVACKNLNRSFIGIEKDEKYFNLAKNRIEKHINQLRF